MVTKALSFVWGALFEQTREANITTIRFQNTSERVDVHVLMVLNGFGRRRRIIRGNINGVGV